MNKMFKISAITASLLVSGILVGCGSSKSGGSDPIVTEPKPMTVVVTDDYVYDATVYGLGNKTRAVMTRNGTKPDNGSKPDVGSTPISDSGVVFAALLDNEKALETSKDNGHNMGKYMFKDATGVMTFASKGGYIDVNGDKQLTSEDAKALFMVANVSHNRMANDNNMVYINPFTTLEAIGNADVKVLFNLDSSNIDTTTDNIEIRKAVAYANAMLIKAQLSGADKYEDTLKQIVTGVTAAIKGGATIAEAVSDSRLSGDDQYKTIIASSTDVKEVDKFIIETLRKNLPFKTDTGATSPVAKPQGTRAPR